MFIPCPLQVQHLTVMGMELHARTRRDLEPDPEFDPICALFYCISSDTSVVDTDGTQLTGTIVVSREHQSHHRGEHLLMNAATVFWVFSPLYVISAIRLMSSCPQQVHEGLHPC